LQPSRALGLTVVAADKAAIVVSLHYGGALAALQLNWGVSQQHAARCFDIDRHHVHAR